MPTAVDMAPEMRELLGALSGHPRHFMRDPATGEVTVSVPIKMVEAAADLLVRITSLGPPAKEENTLEDLAPEMGSLLLAFCGGMAWRNAHDKEMCEVPMTLIDATWDLLRTIRSESTPTMNETHLMKEENHYLLCQIEPPPFENTNPASASPEPLVAAVPAWRDATDAARRALIRRQRQRQEEIAIAREEDPALDNGDIGRMQDICDAEYRRWAAEHGQDDADRLRAAVDEACQAWDEFFRTWQQLVDEEAKLPTADEIWRAAKQERYGDTWAEKADDEERRAQWHASRRWSWLRPWAPPPPADDYADWHAKVTARAQAATDARAANARATAAASAAAQRATVQDRALAAADERIARAGTRQGLLEMEPRAFEKHVAEIFRRRGYTTRLTPVSHDEGLDIDLSRDGERAIVQCKKWQGAVSRPQLQQFYGVMMHEEAVEGFFVTTGRFTDQAIAFAKGKPIRLIDLDGLLSEDLFGQVDVRPRRYSGSAAG
jgi:hypothetical protein